MTDATLHPSRNDVPVLLVHKLVMDRPRMDDERMHLEDWWLEREVADAAVEGIVAIHYHVCERHALRRRLHRTWNPRLPSLFLFFFSCFFPMKILTSSPPSSEVSGQHLESAGAPRDATNPRRRLPHTDGRPVPHPTLYRNTDPRSRHHPAIAN